jgi:hypothetical protein
MTYEVEQGLLVVKFWVKYHSENRQELGSDSNEHYTLEEFSEVSDTVNSLLRIDMQMGKEVLKVVEPG